MGAVVSLSVSVSLVLLDYGLSCLSYKHGTGWEWGGGATLDLFCDLLLPGVWTGLDRTGRGGPDWGLEGGWRAFFVRFCDGGLADGVFSCDLLLCCQRASAPFFFVLFPFLLLTFFEMRGRGCGYVCVHFVLALFCLFFLCVWFSGHGCCRKGVWIGF